MHLIMIIKRKEAINLRVEDIGGLEGGDLGGVE